MVFCVPTTGDCRRRRSCGITVIFKQCSRDCDAKMTAEKMVKFALILPPELSLTPHYRVRGFSCSCCRRLVVSPVLLEMLERLRAACGDIPLTITSGFRCPQHNRSVGGSPASRHMFGLAADIQIPAQIEISEFTEKAKEIVREVRGGYHYSRAAGFVHIDCWPWPPNRRW